MNNTNSTSPSGSARVNPAFRLQRILVPTDFSPESLKGLRYGIAFARQCKCSLVLLHVLERPSIASGFESVPIAVDDTEALRRAETRLAEFAAEHIPPDIAATTVAEYGAPFEEIVSVAKAREIDLIISSTHGRTGLKRVFFGSTAERVLQRAPCPMLVVREREHEFVDSAAEPAGITKLKRILVPIDFSESSRKALRYSIAFAKEFGAEILCLHAMEVPYGVGEGAIVIETEVFRKKLHEQSKGQMATFLREENAPVSEDCIIEMGTPYREIMKAAEAREIDLIVMGTHGRSGIGRFIIGSTTERIVRHAHCPVLVVREREHDFIQGAAV